MVTVLAVVGVLAIAGHIQGYRDRQRIIEIEEKHFALRAAHEELKASVEHVAK